VAALSFAVIGTLAWQLLTQDRDLERQRRQVQLESAADQLVASMRKSLADLQSHIENRNGDLPQDVVVITMTGDRIDSRPDRRLLYYPVAPSAPTEREVFASAERLEFSGEVEVAVAAYRRLAGQADPAVRAGAAMRLGRTHRKAGSTEAALDAYRDLDALDQTIVEDLPASLVASLGRLEAYQKAARTNDARREAESLLTNLHGGRWHLTQAQYVTYIKTARELLPDAAPEDAAGLIRSDVAGDLWRQRGSDHGPTRTILTTPVGTALVVWSATASRLDAVIAGPAYLRTLGQGAAQGSDWAISYEGRPVVGTPPGTGDTAVRAAVTSGLPWTVHVFHEAGDAPLARPRPELIWLLGLVAAVLVAGWHFIFQSVSRERQVARLQSDFVAAVSHEFRSPLTSLTHAADLLVHDRLPSDSLRRQTHEVLVRDTARLRNLVEGLLAFGRLEAGAPFQFEDTDIDTLVRSTVEDFKEDLAAHGFEIMLTSATAEAHARIDREAVARAIRNLLDNAVKYSTDEKRIDVSVLRDGAAIAIAIRDRGIGVPAGEQEAIFEPFVRGTESTSRRIRGTGIGLAMVRQIARGHGGEASMDSASDGGSVFTIRLPATPATGAEVSL
jgi:two-component system phosphate regulon sensor histidine kinase PhoR